MHMAAGVAAFMVMVLSGNTKPRSLRCVMNPVVGLAACALAEDFFGEGEAVAGNE
jgi:hypothetical protein